MDNEYDLLEKLIEILKEAGISPIPATSFLLKKINTKMEHKLLDDIHLKEKYFSPEIINSSPVCFAKSDEVQADYLNEEKIIQIIDECIDRLILRK